MSQPDKKPEEERGIPFFPNHLLKEVVVMCIVLAGMSILAVFFPAPMEEKADPFSTPLHIKPEWYFLAGYIVLAYAEKLAFLAPWAPKVIGVLGQGLVILMIVIFPFLDRNPNRSPRKRPIVITMGGGFLLLFGLLTLLGYLK